MFNTRGNSPDQVAGTCLRLPFKSDFAFLGRRCGEVSRDGRHGGHPCEAGSWATLNSSWPPHVPLVRRRSSRLSAGHTAGSSQVAVSLEVYVGAPSRRERSRLTT